MSLLVAVAATLAERIKINQLAREYRDGRVMWIKRRRRTAPLVLAAANLFFRIADARIRAIEDRPRWQRWEVDCFLKLHGDQFLAWSEGTCAVAAEAMPGFSLAHELDAGRLTPTQAAAAGRELRRAHEIPSGAFEGEWSHGDPHTGNFVYDPHEDRARLIDFEVIHAKFLPASARQADDLLIFLQDVLGRIEASHWLEVACAFLDAYDREEIITCLPAQLALPRGIPRLWWAVRTSYLPVTKVAARLDSLKAAIVARRSLATVPLSCLPEVKEFLYPHPPAIADSNLAKKEPASQVTRMPAHKLS